VVDLDAKEPESSVDAYGSPGVRLAHRKRGLALGSDSELESEANFRHGGRKRSETVRPRDA